MASGTRRSPARARPFAWLLALALWLPVAQWTAATHALLHLGADAGTSEERDAPGDLPGLCAVCIDAAVVGGAAPPPEAPATLPVLAAQTQPQFVAAAARHAATLLPYRSRAPPLPHA